MKLSRNGVHQTHTNDIGRERRSNRTKEEQTLTYISFTIVKTKARGLPNTQASLLNTYTDTLVHTLLSYHIHVDAVGVRPGVLEVLLQPLPQWVWDLVEADEFFDP